MRVATDTGGTFTDLVLEDDDGSLSLYKASTTPGDPIEGVLNVVKIAADSCGLSAREFLERVTSFMHGTTHALNAVVTGRTAKTALITTRGHRDVLVFREGGRREPFNHSQPYPRPYVPRSLTFEVDERIAYDGSVVEPLRDESVFVAIERLRDADIQAVAVCLLWSVSNPAHERRIGTLLTQQLPGVPFTLSSELNPVLREYRRASASAIDASLKPLVTKYISDLAGRLAELGFKGDVRVLSSLGGLKDAAELAAAPIQLLKSGPSTAPIAGRFYGRSALADDDRDLIVTDAGGTTYDVSLVRGGEIEKARDTWIGPEFLGHMTGFPSVSVKSIGAGGGSIAWVDNGGVLHVGPQSQGADPGPACYGRGGVEATITDASVILGYLNPDYFLGGRIRLNWQAAVQTLERRVAQPLGLSATAAAAAMVAVATENMAQAIFDLTVERGVDPARAILIGGGGAAGLNAIFIARRLRCTTVVFPEVAAALSAGGAVLSDLTAQYSQAWFTSTKAFDRIHANQLLGGLRKSCLSFARKSGVDLGRCKIGYSVEARYKNQVWEIDVPLRADSFREPADIITFTEDFHANHERLFAVRDPSSPVEILSWTATVSCPIRTRPPGRLRSGEPRTATEIERRIHLPGVGIVSAVVADFDSMKIGQRIAGPAIVESAYTSVVVDERASCSRSADGSLVMTLDFSARGP